MHAQADHSRHDDHGSCVQHVSSVQSMLLILGLLIFLTGVTVWVAEFDLGSMNIFVAMGVAAVKATLVISYFMHLRWDTGLNRLVVLVTLLMLSLFFAFALMDTHSYRDDVAWEETLQKQS